MAAHQNLSQCLALAHVQARMTPLGRVAGGLVPAASLACARQGKQGYSPGLGRKQFKGELFECCSQGHNGTR